MNILKWGVALFLFTLGVYRLFRANHPRGAGMRVGGRDLFVWSFLMACAHGGGFDAPATAGEYSCHIHRMTSTSYS
jgi:hypothetical protein